ncbi:MAG: multidrug effflux MFS transporter [Corynebacteriales bacterium]|nr:multidrug effflux MFS transporter [Mycobacteriales bacterium]
MTTTSRSAARHGGTRGERTPIGTLLLIVLASLSAIAPIATDLYLPAFPTMTGDLATGATAVQLTLTAFLVGVAVGQLVFGPLSDRVGRLRPLIGGAAICVIASALAALAPTIELLVAARFVQGLAGAAGMVIGRAVISDLAAGPAAARAFSIMTLVTGVAPILAPFVGSLLVGGIGWRGVLWVVFALAAVMLVAVVAVVRETHTPERRRRARMERAENGSAAQDLISRTFLGNTGAYGFGFAVMMAYIAASPFLYQVLLGMNEIAYGLSFGANAAGLVIVGSVAARLSASRSIRGMLGLGLSVVGAATVALLIVVVAGAPHWLIPIPIFVAVSGLGLVLGNATAAALQAVPRASGSGSALLGALQFGLGAAVSPLVSLGGENDPLPLAIVMVTCALIALAAFVVAGRPAD